ncbi:MAG: type II toxin-antitoxin system RelE/ParE family toxin [Ruminococcus sp.]|nr:type II toxin-antitoxin system RelE/ParE family toxin [Ruminococcus sp.]MCM1381906.1 type II toxin-antitoxin system RelE/ParE family toxin [Muribaculaceae bacterium]MCM1478359.1 type II toxin-antitoxin system RelE/ParE family toxin [Muribaculaceae bacterium]
MYEVNITQTARADLLKAALYIAETLNNKAAADRLLDTAEKELSSLADFPERSPLVRDAFLSANGIRMLMIKKYLAFYVVRSETNSVTVLRIIHSRRDWAAVLKEDFEKK